MHEYAARYTAPADSTEYQGGETTLTVRVTPKNGALCTVAPITNEQEALDPTITDGSTLLTEGTDYTVALSRSDGKTTVTITFMGNYYGSITKTVVIAEPTASTLPTASAEPIEALTPAPTASATASALPTGSATTSAEPTETVTPVPTASAVPTASVTPVPTASQTNAPAPPSQVPTGVPGISVESPRIQVKEGRDVLIRQADGDTVLQGPALTATRTGLTVADVLDQLTIGDLLSTDSGWKLEIVTADRNVDLKRATVDTGDYVQLVHPETGAVVDEAAIVIRGDVLGTGIVDIAQVVRIAQWLNGSHALKGLFELAGEFNQDRGVDIADLVYEAEILAGASVDG